MDARGASTRSVSIPVVTYRHIPVGMGGTSSRLHSLVIMVRRGVLGAYKRPGNEGSRAGYGVVSPPASGAEIRPDE